MNSTRRLWQGLAIVFVLSFAALGWLGREIYLAAPPIPDTVRSETGLLLYSSEQIQDGQRAWLAAGGQQLGTVWGHGAYVAPDWSASAWSKAVCWSAWAPWSGCWSPNGAARPCAASSSPQARSTC